VAGQLATGRHPGSSPVALAGGGGQAGSDYAASTTIERVDMWYGGSRIQLAASRARVLAAGDAARRRFERDLHEGTQQRLVSLHSQLCLLESEMPEGHLRERLVRVIRDLDETIDELLDISRGIYPKVLALGGIEPALKVLARRSSVPVDLHMTIDSRTGEQTDTAIYHVVSEALTNAAKHARASRVKVDLETTSSFVRLAVRDDGIGGAESRRGSGLLGLRDRVQALGGRITISSPAGEGTTLLVTIPVSATDRRRRQVRCRPVSGEVPGR
jgi:signal transduction histidine kinase